MEEIYYIKLKNHLFVCPSVRPSRRYLSRVSMEWIETGLLEMKAESSGITKYICTSLYMPVFIHMSAQKALM